MDKITFHVISHTHWDREWYLPFETFRVELVELIDNLLDILEQNKAFIFHLDGQTIILEDYLEIRPHKKEQIKKFVKSGNLLIGPWYVLSDQFLTSGESTIRNLLYGIRIGKEFGSVMMVGYLPDQFGQISQLPQMFKGFNIHSAVIGRGIQDSFAEHNWHGLNGDNVLAVALTNWYNNAQRFPEDKEKLYKYLEKIYETQAHTVSSGNMLLMNGCDHLFAQNNLSEVLNKSPANAKWQLTHTSLPLALNKIQSSKEKEKFPIYFGELRDDNNKYILAGTLSSRIYLKLENYKCQTKLEKIIEPLSVLLTLASHLLPPTSYPYDLIKYAWKILIQNHAHDSICGCSIDEVHREMEMRFLKVRQVLDKLQERLLLSLCSCRDIPLGRLYLQLINLSNYKRSDVIETTLEFPLGPVAEHPSASPTINKEEIKNVILKKDGKEVKVEVLDSKQTFKMIRSKDEVPLLQAVQELKVLFEADLEPFSITTYNIVEERIGVSARRCTDEELHFENDFYKLSINNDGTLNVLLKETNHKFENIHYLSIEDDHGDEYNFEPGEISKTILSKSWHWDIKVIEENKFRKRFLLKSDDVPELCIESEIICFSNSGRIDFKTKINNKMKNKRIRLHFPDGLDTGYINADTPFGVLLRARPPHDWINYATTQPLHNWIDHSNNNLGLSFFGSGLSEYELYEDSCGFAVTLLRCVERLTKTKSHSMIMTSEAQCNREIDFSYSIFPHKGSWEDAKVHEEQILYQVPLITNQSNQPLNISSFIEIPRECILSALKRSEDKENVYILRLFNPFNKTLNDCKLKLNFQFKSLSLLNLNEELIDTLKSSKDILNFQMKPYQILTFGIEV